jgi:hypothetical protein
MRALLTFANVMLLAGLAGCASGWSRPNTNEAEFNRDRLQCEQQGSSKYPVRIESFGTGRQGPSLSDCRSFGLHLSCSAAPASAAPPTQYDVNESARANEIRSCLRSKGYVSKPFYESPKANPHHSPEREEYIG